MRSKEVSKYNLIPYFTISRSREIDIEKNVVYG